MSANELAGARGRACHENAIGHRLAQLGHNAGVIENRLAVGRKLPGLPVMQIRNRRDQQEVMQTEVAHDTSRCSQIAGHLRTDQDDSAVL